MKTNCTLNPFIHLIKTTLVLFILSVFTACSVSENIPGSETKDAGEISNKAKAGRKERSVKIYPDMVKKMIHVKNVEEQPVDFYVFDTEGAIVLHYKMDENDHKKITGLKRGEYVYQVFGGDEMTSSGKITVK